MRETTCFQNPHFAQGEGLLHILVHVNQPPEITMNLHLLETIIQYEIGSTL